MIGHTGGIIDPPEEYLPLLREICDRHNVLLIFDEIITGIGRTGNMFAAETFGVVPDMLCIGKGLGGGYAPLSAMICRRPIADAFWGPIAKNPGFVEGHTFEGNPISCAAGIAVLREILERDLCANARAQGERLRTGFQRLAKKHGIIGDIRGKGLFQGIEFVRNPATKEPRPAIGVQIGRRFGKMALVPLRPALHRRRPAADRDRGSEHGRGVGDGDEAPSIRVETLGAGSPGSDGLPLLHGGTFGLYIGHDLPGGHGDGLRLTLRSSIQGNGRRNRPACRSDVLWLGPHFQNQVAHPNAI